MDRQGEELTESIECRKQLWQISTICEIRSVDRTMKMMALDWRHSSGAPRIEAQPLTGYESSCRRWKGDGPYQVTLND